MYSFRDPDDPKYRIVVKTPQECILTVEHSCGHTSRYNFKNATMANDLVDYYLAEDCPTCKGKACISTVSEHEPIGDNLD